MASGSVLIKTEKPAGQGEESKVPPAAPQTTTQPTPSDSAANATRSDETFQRPANPDDKPGRGGMGGRGARGGRGGPHFPFRGRGGRMGPGGGLNNVHESNSRKREHSPSTDAMSMASDDSRASNMASRRGPRDGKTGNSEMDRLQERISSISGPTIDLPPLDLTEKKFAGRNRLYVGNLTPDVTKEELETLFSQFGELSECFVNPEKMFAFIRFDYRANAEKARREMDQFVRKNRAMRIRFAPHGACIRVKNLDPFVTNELLEWAFQVFGEIERAIVVADERGRSTGEGIVEFARKPAALQAQRLCTENCYFITSSLRPVIVEPLEQNDEVDGFSERNLYKKGPDFLKAREVGPRFAAQGSFESEFGKKWKTLHELYQQKAEALKRELKLEEEKLEAQMDFARYEHETEMLREQLRRRELDKERQKREWEMRERAVAEQRSREEEIKRRQLEELENQLRRQQEDEYRRRQEETMFLQAHQLSSLLEKEEKKMVSHFERRDGGIPSLTSTSGDMEDSSDRHGNRSRDDFNRGYNNNTRWGGTASSSGRRGGDFKRRRY